MVDKLVNIPSFQVGDAGSRPAARSIQFDAGYIISWLDG